MYLLIYTIRKTHETTFFFKINKFQDLKNIKSCQRLYIHWIMLELLNLKVMYVSEEIFHGKQKYLSLSDDSV
jgi:hypothetical protein